MEEQGVTIVPLDVRTLHYGHVYIRQATFIAHKCP